MGLLTPLGEIRIFLDGKPKACDLLKMRIEPESPLEGKYKLVVRVDQDDMEHGIMCAFNANQPVICEKEPEDGYCTYAYYSMDRMTKLSIGILAHTTYAEDAVGNKIMVSEPDYEAYHLEDQGIYYEMYRLLPETKTETYVFGVAWLGNCDTENSKTVSLAASPILDEEPLVTVGMFDKNDLITQDYGISRLELYKNAAAAGDTRAMDTVGSFYKEGRYVKQDPEEGFRWYKMAAEAGDMLGIYDCALSLYRGEGVEKDEKKAFEAFKYVADNGLIAFACHFVARYYEEGWLGEPDLDKALEYYQMAIDKGMDEDEESYDRVLEKKAAIDQNIGSEKSDEGNVQNNNEGYAVDYGEFRIRNSDEDGNLCFQVIKGDDCDQVNTLSVCWDKCHDIFNLLGMPDVTGPHMNDMENENDPRKFMVLYNPFYSRPYPMVIVLKYIREGNDKIIVDVDESDMDFVEFVKRNFLQAGKDYRTISLEVKPELTEEEADILNQIGCYCLRGTAFEQNTEAARTLFEISASAGNAGAKNNLGTMYDNGIGTYKDVFLAAELYRSAAEAGCSGAMVNLGKIYEYGKLDYPDIDKAIEVYQKAADMDDEKGKAGVERLRERKEHDKPDGPFRPYEKCEVYVKDETGEIMMLSMGADAVIEFSRIAEEPINGAISVETSFGCNVDVKMKGNDLIEFIRSTYPKMAETAEKLIKPEKIYTIVCYDKISFDGEDL